MGLGLPEAIIFGSIIGGLGIGASLYTGKRTRDKQSAAQAQNANLARSLAPPTPTGPTASELESTRLADEATKAKAAAEKRTSDLEAGIAADTASLVANRRRSIGLAATVKTSARGLTGAAPVEKKTLLGQGGPF